MVKGMVVPMPSFSVIHSRRRQWVAALAVGALLSSCGSDPGRAPTLDDEDGGDASVPDAGFLDAGTAPDAGPVPTICPAPANAVEEAWIGDDSLCLVRWAENLTGARGI